MASQKVALWAVYLELCSAENLVASTEEPMARSTADCSVGYLALWWASPMAENWAARKGLPTEPPKADCLVVYLAKPWVQLTAESSVDTKEPQMERSTVASMAGHSERR